LNKKNHLQFCRKYLLTVAVLSAEFRAMAAATDSLYQLSYLIPKKRQMVLHTLMPNDTLFERLFDGKKTFKQLNKFVHKSWKIWKGLV